MLNTIVEMYTKQVVSFGISCFENGYEMRKIEIAEHKLYRQNSEIFISID